MTSALIVLGGAAFIGLSLYFRFTPRLRVGAALVVGSLLAGVVATRLNGWLAHLCGVLSRPVGHLIGQPAGSVAVAIPSVIAFVMATIVVVFLRSHSGHGGSVGGGHGGRGRRHGGHGGGSHGGGLARAALVCGLLLPIVAGGLTELIRSVVTA